MCERSFDGKASGKANKIERETMNEMQEIFNNATMLRRSFLKADLIEDIATRKEYRYHGK